MLLTLGTNSTGKFALIASCGSTLSMTFWLIKRKSFLKSPAAFLKCMLNGIAVSPSCLVCILMLAVSSYSGMFNSVFSSDRFGIPKVPANSGIAACVLALSTSCFSVSVALIVVLASSQSIRSCANAPSGSVCLTMSSK